MPGAGKTTLGPKLADHLQRPFFDLDAFIEQEEQKTVAELFAQVGETGFREKETAALRKLTDTAPKAVIATGGGTPCFNDNMRFMNAAGLTVYLQTPVAILAERLLKQDLKKRPLLAGKNKQELQTYLTSMLEERQNFYQQATVVAQPAPSVAVFLQKIINALPFGA